MQKNWISTPFSQFVGDAGQELFKIEGKGCFWCVHILVFLFSVWQRSGAWSPRFSPPWSSKIYLCFPVLPTCTQRSNSFSSRLKLSAYPEGFAYQDNNVRKKTQCCVFMIYQPAACRTFRGSTFFCLFEVLEGLDKNRKHCFLQCWLIM